MPDLYRDIKSININYLPDDTTCRRDYWGERCIPFSEKPIMLSIPSSIKITTNMTTRPFTTGIYNKRQEERCYCVYPHLLALNGTYSRDYQIDRNFFSLRRQMSKNGINLSNSVQEKLKRYTPESCWNGNASCKPNTWFIGARGTRIPGKEFGQIKFLFSLPSIQEGLASNRSDPLQAPHGRYAFIVDVCEYRPRCNLWRDGPKRECQSWEDCESCKPEQCSKPPYDECSNENDDGCYLWYGSSSFHIKNVS